jgi:hypothetical protein
LETNGVAIGPGSSNVIAEFILGKIDAELSEKYSYNRHVDDYKCYCDTYEEATNFIAELSDRLLEFKLCLNLKKTKIIALPTNVDDSWVSDLATRVPKGKDLRLIEVSRFIDYALDIHRQCPDGSVLKYAINSVAPRLEKKDPSIIEFKKRLLGLAFHYPNLLPSLEYVCDNSFDDLTRVSRESHFSYTEQELNTILAENAKYKRSDAMVWGLYFLQKQGLNANEHTVEAVIKTRDCLAITALLNTPENADKVVSVISSIIASEDEHFLDNYWILLYEAYRRGLINNPYNDDDTFEVLKINNVCFLNSI